MGGWSFKMLNLGGATTAPPAAAGNATLFLPGNPFVSAYNGQMHVAYGAIDDTVRDIWCTPFPSVPAQWNQQRIDQDSNPGKVPLQAGPSIGVYQNQQHFCYTRGVLDPNSGFPEPGTIYDSFYDGSGWRSQQIGSPVAVYSNLNFAPPVFVGPFLVSIWPFANQQHFTYLDNHNNIFDTFYDGSNWHTQKINNGGNTPAPGAYSMPFGCVFTPPTAPFLPPNNLSGQQHIGFLAGDGSIWDSWWDGQSGAPWAAQKLTLNGRTSAPTATGGPCVWVVPEYFAARYHIQQHFTYLAEGGALWDAWYDFPNNRWNAQKFNIDAAGAPYHTTNAPAAAGNPVAFVVGNMISGKLGQEQHVAYRDATGAIWDLWYNGSPQWQSRKVNLNGETGAPAAIGDPFLFYYPGVDNDGTVYGQLHFAWQAEGGQIWDAWYNLTPIPGGPTGRG